MPTAAAPARPAAAQAPSRAANDSRIHDRVFGVIEEMPIALSALTLEGGVPPTEIRIFKAGDNPSTKGSWTFDDAAAESVMQRFTVMNRRVTFDYDHGALQKNPIDPSKSSRSAGSCVIEMRGQELWATDIKWTPDAAKAIAAGEWLYWSPAFDRTKDGRPTWLINVALTNNPALFGLDELQAANALLSVQAAELASAPATGTRNPGYPDIAASAPSVEPVPFGNPLQMSIDTARRSMARRTACMWLVNNPAAKIVPPDAPQHPAAMMPLTGAYDDPIEAGGWMGWIEPTGTLQVDMGESQDPDAARATPDKDWIAFVAFDGRTLLWEQREPSGAVIGNPIIWMRDLTTLFATDAPGLPSVVVKYGKVVKPSEKGHGADGDGPGPAMTASATPAAAPAVPAALSASPVPVAKLGGCGSMNTDVVSAYPYDYQRDSAAGVADAVLSDPGVTPGSSPDHPAATAPLTGRYTDPLTTGKARLLGWIEPATKEWICFVSMDGRAVLWTARIKSNDDGLGRTGLGTGTPIVFKRDIATLSVKTSATAKPTTVGGVVALGAVPYRGYPEPKDPPDQWDADAAIHRLRVWASADQSGDTSQIDWNKFEQGFAFVKDSAVGGHGLADFLLPHHDVKHGEIVTHRRGVFAAAGRVGSADIPEKDRQAVMDHLAKHYHQWGAKAPWETQEKAAMHAKLDDYAKDKGFNKTEMKARLKLALPGHMHDDASAACSDNEKEHPEEEKMKGILKALHAFDKGPGKDDEEARATTAVNPLQKQVQASSVAALGVAMGLPVDATEAAVVTGVGTLLNGVQRLNTITGKDTFQESLGVIRGWKDAAEEGRTAVARLLALETDGKQKTALSSIEKAESEFRLTPAKRATALEVYAKDGPAALSAYLSACDVIPALAAGKQNPAAPSGTSPPSGFTPATAEQIAALNAAGQLPGAPAAGARPASEVPAGGPAAVVLSKQHKAFLKGQNIDWKTLSPVELKAIADMDFTPIGLAGLADD